jgi:hypothetical protein
MLSSRYANDYFKALFLETSVKFQLLTFPLAVSCSEQLSYKQLAVEYGERERERERERTLTCIRIKGKERSPDFQ